MDYASATVRGWVSRPLAYTAPCLGKMVHLKDFAVLTEVLMHTSGPEMDDLPNADSDECR